MWHRSTDLAGADVVVLPGGFSYGDYLRPGAIARFSPVMRGRRGARRARAGRSSASATASRSCARRGCCPARWPGTAGCRSSAGWVTVRVETDATPFTARYRPGQQLRVPVAHGDGRYVADDATLDRLEREERVVFRYVGGNPNGAMRDIAGITNEGRNVVGLMPHPERAAEALLGSSDGAAMFALAAASPSPEGGTMTSRTIYTVLASPR